MCVAAMALMSSPTDEARPSCESKCQRLFDRCIRQGNPQHECYDLVFRECMRNECDNCICCKPSRWPQLLEDQGQSIPEAAISAFRDPACDDPPES